VTGSGDSSTDRPIDSTLRVWARNGASHRVVGGHFSAIRAVATSGNGKQIYSAADFGSISITGGRDAKVGRAWIWNNRSAQIDDPFTQARKSVRSCLSPAERADFSLSPRPPEWCIRAAKRPYNNPNWRTPDAPDPDIARDYAIAFEVAACNQNHKDADIAATEAMKRQPDLATNRLMVAVADMLNGRTAAAYREFHAIRQLPLPPEGLRVETWEKEMLLVFRQLRACGNAHPLMDEIEQAFASPAKPQ
jgi:hypothetical protein